MKLRKRRRRGNEQQEKQHQAYLCRKEYGWQAAYEEKQKTQRKAKITKLKDEIRKEDIEKGIFISVENMPKFKPKKLCESKKA